MQYGIKKGLTCWLTGLGLMSKCSNFRQINKWNMMMKTCREKDKVYSAHSKLNSTITYLRPTAECIEHIKENKASKCHRCVTWSYDIVSHLKINLSFIKQQQ